MVTAPTERGSWWPTMSATYAIPPRWPGATRAFGAPLAQTIDFTHAHPDPDPPRPGGLGRHHARRPARRAAHPEWPAGGRCADGPAGRRSTRSTHFQPDASRPRDGPDDRHRPTGRGR